MAKTKINNFPEEFMKKIADLMEECEEHNTNNCVVKFKYGKYILGVEMTFLIANSITTPNPQVIINNNKFMYRFYVENPTEGLYCIETTGTSEGDAQKKASDLGLFKDVEDKYRITRIEEFQIIKTSDTANHS